MSRIWGVSARCDPVFQRHKAVAERWIVPLLLAGLIALAVSGVAALLAVATDYRSDSRSVPTSTALSTRSSSP